MSSQSKNDGDVSREADSWPSWGMVACGVSGPVQIDFDRWDGDPVKWRLDVQIPCISVCVAIAGRPVISRLLRFLRIGKAEDNAATLPLPQAIFGETLFLRADDERSGRFFATAGAGADGGLVLELQPAIVTHIVAALAEIEFERMD